MDETKTAAAILKSHFEKLKRENPSFSMRALALRFGVSHSFLSRIFAGKAKLPKSLFEPALQHLKIDAVEAANLRMMCFHEEAVRQVRREIPGTLDYLQVHEIQLKLLRKWWNLAIMDLLACDLNVPFTRSNVADFLPVERKEIDASIDELIDAGLVAEQDGRLSKVVEKVRIGSRAPSQHTKRFYEQILALASKELSNQDEESYRDRLILGFTCSANRNQIQKAKQKLAAALQECAETLAEGECTDVFLVQGSLFSVLRKD